MMVITVTYETGTDETHISLREHHADFTLDARKAGCDVPRCRQIIIKDQLA
jgi:hypothetical protein